MLGQKIKQYGLFVAGTLVVGAISAPAHASFIKATITGEYPSIPGTPITFDFTLWNYNNKTTSDTWSQTGPLYGGPYYGPSPLYGYGTAVSNVITGSYDPHSSPASTNEFSLAPDGTGFRFYIDGPPIKYIKTTYALPTTDTIENIEITGNLDGFTSGYTGTNVVAFIANALTGGPPPSGTFACTGTCSGLITETTEGGLGFTWSQIKFEQIAAAPAPLPALGAAVAFKYTRKLRKKIYNSRNNLLYRP